MTLPSALIGYLNERGISNETILKHKIGWNGHTIVIPISNQAGTVIFKKYRRSPNSDVGPKYTYDKGSVAAIYNIENLHHAKSVVITEGEFDALVLESNGIVAVSSTSGSATFKPEWAKHFFGKEVFICYDTDEAGIAGAIRVASIIPHARIISLPKGQEIKDVTDFFVKVERPLPKFLSLMAEAKGYNISLNPANVVLDDKEILRRAKIKLDDCVGERRRIQNDGKDSATIEKIIEYYCGIIEKLESKTKKRPVTEPLDGTRIDKAKAHPIDNLIEFNGHGFAKCLWHEDSTPSMHYHKDMNRVKCFGCSFYGDAIDVYQKLKGCSVKEAIDALMKLNGN